VILKRSPCTTASGRAIGDVRRRRCGSKSSPCKGRWAGRQGGAAPH